ncbi:hypothetical protein QO010_003802 [Caulobacter ginsengisoli]|uniref:DUF4410 domain-containing protein n=1 Tax=Caulobacter ginsengisoli TaxID=400775 RepID=A0ABU0IVH8_9CAUL|nr:hypothetical protein [Caulobacter ginsengisoli]MDQ0466009.1 hypothetical protein [Caulobacter ginsengisoli]
MNRRLVAAALLGAAGLVLSGCATPPMAPPQATLDNIQALRAANLTSMKVGAFTAGPGRPQEMDKRIVVRAGAQAAPNGSYARYLADTIRAELDGGGRFDANSATMLSGVITDSHVDSGMPVGHASLAVRFTLTRDGKVVFEKTLSVDTAWESAFMGVVAIPDAFNHYTGLFNEITTKLFADPDFRAAAKAG